jgi:hypothetical protein
MEPTLYQRYLLEEAIAAFGEDVEAEVLCDGHCVVLPHVVLCLITAGPPPLESHFESPSRFTWKVRQFDFEEPSPKHFPLLPERVLEVYSADRKQKIREHHLFVRNQSDDRYVYVGSAHLGSYGCWKGDASANFSLTTKLPRTVYLSLGGSLLPPQPLAHLMEAAEPALDLQFHQAAFDLLHLKAQKSEEWPHRLAEFERQNRVALPAAIREWYNIHGAIDILRAINSPHHPVELKDDDHRFIERYLATAPYRRMLPILIENQGVWYLAAPFDAGENPPVYIGDDESTSFEWHLHAERFSDFVYAWAWDYTNFARDYVIGVSDFIEQEDLAAIYQTFQKGPTTYKANPWFLYDRFERYYRGDQKVTQMITDKDIVTWFSAESSESFRELLGGPWHSGDILARMGEVDLEMQKMYLGAWHL